MKIVIFTALKNRCILHGPVFVMSRAFTVCSGKSNVLLLILGPNEIL